MTVLSSKLILLNEAPSVDEMVSSVLLFPFQAFSTVVTAAEGPTADAASSDQVDDVIQYPFSFLSQIWLSTAYRISIRFLKCSCRKKTRQLI